MAWGINTINGIDYVYEYKSHWNAELHRSEQKRDYIGKVKDGAFVPNKIYKMRMELEALKRQNGLPSDTDERPIDEELSELIKKHSDHRIKLAEKRVDGKKEDKPSEEPAIEKIAAPEESEISKVPVEEVKEAECLSEPAVEVEPEVKKVPKAKKHVLRAGELDDEEFGPDLFKVQPSVAPVEEEIEEEVVIEEEEGDENPDLFQFTEEVELLVEEPSLKAEEPKEEPEAPAEETLVEDAPVEEAPMKEEAPKKAKKTKKSKDKVEEDNGQLFLF